MSNTERGEEIIHATSVRKQKQATFSSVLLPDDDLECNDDEIYEIQATMQLFDKGVLILF